MLHERFWLIVVVARAAVSVTSEPHQGLGFRVACGITARLSMVCALNSDWWVPKLRALGLLSAYLWNPVRNPLRNP